LGAVQSSEHLLGLPAADVERIVAGARRREERMQDHVMRLFLGIISPYLKEPITARDLLGRELGVSNVPGYRPLPPKRPNA